MGPVFKENFNDFTICIFVLSFDNMFWGSRVEAPL
jgi:hypothetical protein